MVQKFGRFLSTGFMNPELGAFAYSSVILLVTLVGIFRERLLAGMVGPGPILDAYVLAHKIPDILYVTTAALFVATTLLPHLAREKTPEAKERLLSELYTVQLVGSGILALIFILLNPIILPLLGPGFSTQTITMAQNMSALLLLSPIVMGASNLLGLHSQMKKQFIILALSPLLYNLGTVISIYFGYSIIGYMVLPVAILVGAIAHLGVQIFASSRTAQLPQLVRRINWSRARKIIYNAIPRTFTMAVVPITALGIIALGSKLASGSVSLLNFAIVIQNVPVTLIGASMAVASFPVLVEMAASGDKHAFSNRVATSFRVMTTLALPVTVLVWVMRREIVTLLLSSGNFTAEHAAVTAGIVGILALGLWAQSTVLLGARVYYAHEKTWRPFYQNLIGMAVTFALAYGLSYICGVSLVMLATAFVVGWWVNALISVTRILSTYCYVVDVKSMVRGMAGSILAAIVVLIVSLLVRDLVIHWAIDGKIVTVMAQGFVVGVAGLLAGIGTLTIIGDQEAKLFMGFLRRKFKI